MHGEATGARCEAKREVDLPTTQVAESITENSSAYYHRHITNNHLTEKLVSSKSKSVLE